MIQCLITSLMLFRNKQFQSATAVRPPYVHCYVAQKFYELLLRPRESVAFTFFFIAMQNTILAYVLVNA